MNRGYRLNVPIAQWIITDISYVLNLSNTPQE